MDQVLTPAVQNVTLTLADTQYYLDLPDGCKHFSFQCRTLFDVRFAFVDAKVATPTAPWATCKAGTAFSSPDKLCIRGGYTRVYFASPQAGVVVELMTWV